MPPMKYFVLSLCFMSSVLAQEPWEMCSFSENSGFKPIAQCSVYNGLAQKRARHFVHAMKACVGKNEKGEYAFKSMVEKSTWMGDRSVVDTNYAINFDSKPSLVKEKKVTVKEKREKKTKVLKSVTIKIHEHEDLDGDQTTTLKLTIQEEKVSSLKMTTTDREAFWPIPKIDHSVIMGCESL